MTSGLGWLLIDHDDLCSHANRTTPPPLDLSCDCPLIERVRADERRTIADWLDRRADIITDAETYITDEDVRGYADEIRGEDQP